MFRKTLIGLASAAALATAFGATASTASATTIKFGFDFGGYNDGYYDAGYGDYHCHKKYKWVKVKKVWYDDYGYKHVSWKWVKKVVKFCHYSSH